MRDLIRIGRRNPQVIALARHLVSGLPSKDYSGEARAIFEYVRDRIRYVRDPVDVEALSDPIATLNMGSGDCDDKVVLLCSLLNAIGHETRMIAMREDRNGPYCHVYAETKLGTRWIPMETTEPWEFGRAAPSAGTMVVYT